MNNEINLFQDVNQFIEILDDNIPPHISEKVKHDLSEMIKSYPEKTGWVDMFNAQEKARVLTIKERISKTHTWEKAITATPDGNRVDTFWCQKCNIRASAFDNIRTISCIMKVPDHLPSYTVHNEYLMFTCEEVQIFMHSSNKACFDCGIGDAAGTPDCVMEDIED